MSVAAGAGDLLAGAIVDRDPVDGRCEEGEG